MSCFSFALGDILDERDLLFGGVMMRAAYLLKEVAAELVWRDSCQ